MIDHLEICSVQPMGAALPITSTGYLSRFMQPGIIANRGGNVVMQVIAWLEEEAASPNGRRI